MTSFIETPAAESDASGLAQVHLEAMDNNELLHAQFPSKEGLHFLRGYLEKETVEFLQSSDKGVLVAKDSQNGEIASFVKWIVYREGGNEDSAADDTLPSCCRAEYVKPYADLTASVRKSVMGNDPYYRKFSAPERNNLLASEYICSTRSKFLVPGTD